MFWDNLLETAMLICFAVAWPASIYKSWVSRTRKGKSLAFMLVIILGYILGMIKVARHNILGFMMLPYSINTLLVICDLVLYYRNYRLDIERDKLRANNQE